MRFENINKIFNEKFNGNNVDEYIIFCLENEYCGEEYSEIHHILPRSKFPEYEFSDMNLVRLKYKDHIKAHILLAKAIPIKSFIIPVNFMVDDIETKNKLKLLGIEKWKKSEQYKTWVNNHKELWDSQKIGGERYEHMLYMTKLAYGSDEIISKRKEAIKKSWSDEKRNKKSLYNIEKYENYEERKKLSDSCKKAWSNKSEEERNEFIKKRSEFNKSEEGRKKNSEGVKKAYAEKNLAEKISKAHIGKKWWNKDGNEIKSYEAPDETWNRGRAMKYTKEMVEKRNKTNKANKALS